MRVFTAVTAGAILGGACAMAFQAPAPAVATLDRDTCGASSSAQLRTTLYFGTNRPNGSVSELEWQLFVRDEVTTRFPDGLTVWDAYGQWRPPGGELTQERSKVLLIVHDDSDAAKKGVLDVIARYRKIFEQQSVLWETARVCVAL
ncbi:MAG TPA: DUF3574 domain-containing protein [Vicinamibacterales bacterium]|nr:DUF3574 domain-containing protein [Vicinamibacterales bacterium]